ncbi:hypothetical protein Taro_038741 [Colocasia esculenta]|uniref:Uncharacterized protein n=1 Tax=Colocasia esculenta TaxID=4460 RepID=A0A843WN43_COLES|nr:hypothetical protein [Colocasia esculenta]
MDEERLLAKSVQYMGRREMARNLHNNESESCCQSRGQQAYKWEKELKQPTTFQVVFDKIHKKKGMDKYISDRAREVVYAGEEEQQKLDPEVCVAASGAPNKAHVYGFALNMDTSCSALDLLLTQAQMAAALQAQVQAQAQAPAYGTGIGGTSMMEWFSG